MVQSVRSTDFQKRIGAYIKTASRGDAVIVSSHDRPAVVLVAYDEWQRLSGKIGKPGAKQPRVCAVQELVEDGDIEEAPVFHHLRSDHE